MITRRSSKMDDQQQVTTAEENSKGSNEPPAKRRKQKKRTTMIGQLQALPPTQVVIKAEHVAEALAASDVTTFNKLFEVAVRARQVDVVLEVILKMCADSDKNVPLSFDALSKFGQHFVTLGSGTASETLEAFLKILKAGKSARVISYLINRLISSVDILRNSKFRAAVKTQLPKAIDGSTYSHFLAESLCFTVLMEASYLDDVNMDSLAATWKQVKTDPTDPLMCLLDLALSCAYVDVGYCEEIASRFAASLAHFSMDSRDDSYQAMFSRLLDQHMSSVSHLLTAADLSTFISYLISLHLESNSLVQLTKDLHSRCDLPIGFYDCYYTGLFKLLGVECKEHNAQIGETIAKINSTSKTSSLSKALEVGFSAESMTKWTPSKKALDLIGSACYNDIVDLCPAQRFVVILLVSLITDAEVFSLVLRSLSDICEIEAVKMKLTTVLKLVSAESFSVKGLYKVWLKNGSLEASNVSHVVALLAWISIAIVGESAARTLLKIASKSSPTAHVTLAAAVEVFTALEEYDEDLAGSITTQMDLILENCCWSSVKNAFCLEDIERSVLALRPLQRFCRFVHKRKRTFVSLASSSKCLKLAKQICRGKLNDAHKTDEGLYKRVVEEAADFLLFAGYVMNWGKSVIDWEYLISLAQVDVELAKKVIVRATNEEVAVLLPALTQIEVTEANVPLILTVGRFIAERKSVAGLLTTALEPFVGVLTWDDHVTREKLRFATSIVPVLSGCPLEEDFVNLMLGMVGIIEWCDIAERRRFYLVGDMASLMIAIIRSSVGSDRFSVIGAIVGKLINLTHSLKKSSESTEALKTEHERLEHTVASMCHSIVGCKDKFARIAPFVVSECLASDREAALSMHRLLGACDKFSIAMLSSNLPTQKKRCFAHLYPQFANANKIVV